MPQKQNPCELRASWGAKKLYIFKILLGWIFFMDAQQSS
jgi:hypothetical protein